jgi:hypothetical protein
MRQKEMMRRMAVSFSEFRPSRPAGEEGGGYLCGTFPLAFFGRPGEVPAGPPLRRRVEENSEEARICRKEGANFELTS